MPANRRPRQRPERRTLLGADTAMVRPLGFLVGLGFITALVLAILTTPLSNEPNVAPEFPKPPKHPQLASDGLLLPHWDHAQLPRGMQVYPEVCPAPQRGMHGTSVSL